MKMMMSCLCVVMTGAALALDFNAPVEKLGGDFKFTEGPVWVAARNELLFTDIPANRIVRLRDGKFSTFRTPSNNANGLTLDKQGRLIACEHGSRKVTRTEADGTITVLAERYEGKRLNSPNDAVVGKDGAIYFTDPPYGVKPEERELDFQGVYRISPDGKTLKLLARDFIKPNGLAFTPDGKVLYVNDTEGGHIRAFDVAADGTLANSRVFAKTSGSDGMKVDAEGIVYCTTAEGVMVFDPKGKHLGTFVAPEQPANCALGDADMKSLYMTCRTGLYRVRLAPRQAAVPKQQPNFVLVLGEGHGWSSTSVRMDDAVAASKSSLARTPNLEKLAAGGMRMAEFYAPSPRCTPTRAAIFTGKSPAQLHMTFVGEGKKESGANPNGRVITPTALMEMPTGETTIAELLKGAGYATAHFGKWHVGRTSPSQHGFDESDGATNNGGPDNVANPHPKQLYGMTARGMEFMARQVKAGKPFYLQLSHYASRQGGDASPEALAAVKAWGGNLNERETGEAAADLDLDIAFGKVLDKIDELGIANNTYVIFTTDHGTPGRNPPLAGGKGTVAEGGLRVPFIIRGPGIQAGACSHVFATGVDLLPTLAALAKVTAPLPRGIEGGSLAAVLTNGGKGAVQRPRGDFVVHFPHYDKDAIGPASAILAGDFKLIRAYETGALTLYNISRDPSERRDLATELPDKVRDLNQRLTDYLTAVDAQMPKPNPDYDAAKPGVPINPKRGGGKRKQQS